MVADPAPPWSPIFVLSYGLFFVSALETFFFRVCTSSSPARNQSPPLLATDPHRSDSLCAELPGLDMVTAAPAARDRDYCSLCHHSRKDIQRPSESKETTKMPSNLVSRPSGTIKNEAHHRAIPFSAVTARTS